MIFSVPHLNGRAFFFFSRVRRFIFCFSVRARVVKSRMRTLNIVTTVILLIWFDYIVHEICWYRQIVVITLFENYLGVIW